MVRHLALAVALGIAPAQAIAGQCRVFELGFTPAEGSTTPMRAPLQIVAWLEDAQGQYVDTIFITAQTGTYGLGNRPGRFDFNSGPMWPYGRRITVFPVWAHRHGLTFPEVVFQDGKDDNLSHRFEESSTERHYCLPLRSDDAKWNLADAGSCATTVFTDKGVLGPGVSRYPPRNDLVIEPIKDDSSAAMFAMLNSFDAVSHATPPAGIAARFGWSAPPDLPDGDYVVWIEVSREFDFNETYNEATYPSPAGISFVDWGEPFRGQPSVLYQVPITLSSETATTGVTLDHVGYGDPDGLDGNVRAPDGTITTGVTGSGAERLLVRAGPGDPHRVRVAVEPVPDFGDPAAIGEPTVGEVTSTSAVVNFLAPGDDGLTGTVRGYEVRIAAGEAITEATFPAATELKTDLPIGEPGTLQTLTIDQLLYATSYSVAIRALDDCGNAGPISVLSFNTAERRSGEVDACFIATAAYGSALAGDVQLLRRFRDAVLEHTVLGELAVEAYYTFGPALAGVVGESDLLRATARAVLAPVVATIRRFVG